MPTEIAVPFRLDGNGRVVTVTDPDAQVRQHVMALINTHPEERAMVSGYGVDIHSLLFLDEQDEIATQVSLRVRNAMQKFEPGVELITARSGKGSSEDNITKVDIEYRRLDAPDSGSMAHSNAAVIGANGVVREIVRG